MCKTQKEIEAKYREDIISKLEDNVFVEAGAGAGKTTLIVTRVINQLKSGMSPDRIVVITFTNAAAEELRSRITARVREEAFAGGHTDEAQKRLMAALQQLDLMKISTIHSFCFTLLKERIFDARLPMDVSLMEEAQTEEQKHKIFVEWASTLTEADWDKLVSCGDKKSDIATWMERFYEDICELPKDTDIYCDRSLFTKNYQAQAKLLVEDFEKRFCKEAGHLSGSNITKVSDIPDKMLLEASKKVYSELIKTEINYLEALKLIRDCITGSKYKKNKKKYFKSGAVGDVMVSDMECRNWYETEHHDEVDSLLGQNEDYKYTQILDYALKARDYYRANRPLRYVSNDDLLQKTHSLVCESEEARDYFAGKIGCLYVDEFQDTDHIQEEFIWKLCATKEDDKKLRDGVLFLVGDPKQSIYRFRGAEPEVYFHAKEKMAKLSNAKVYSLNNNYRSNEEIINWVNDSFRPQKISKDTAYRDMVFNRKLPEQKDATLLSGVYYYSSPILAEANVSQDVIQLAEMIDTLVGSATITDYDKAGEPLPRTVKYSDFLVLCYSKTEMNFYLKEMQNKGIPVQINGAVPLKQNQVIGNYVRLFDALVHRKDKAKRVGALEALRESGVTEEAAVLDALQEEIKGMSLCGIAETLATKWELLLPQNFTISKELMQSLQSKLWQMIENVFAANVKDSDSMAERFWNYRGIVLERELPLEEKGEAVRFMNVHKAKGLEGNIVILTKRNEKMKFHAGAFRKGNMYYPALGDGFGGIKWTSYTSLKDIFDAAEKEEAEEQTRLQYVTVTRAKQAFIVMDAISENCMFTAPYYNFDESNINRSIKTLLEQFPEKTVTNPAAKKYIPATKKLEVQKTVSGKKQDEAVYDKYSPSELETVSETRRKALAEIDRTTIVKSTRPKGNIFGTAMHRGLELMILRWRRDFSQSPEQLQKVIKACVNQAVFEGQKEIKKNEMIAYQEFLTEILNAFANWAYEEKLFTSENVEAVYTEYEFSYATEEMEINGKSGEVWINGTADLMILRKDGTLQILDYKSDRDDYLTEEQFVCALKETYGGQLALYKKSMARLFAIQEEKITLGIFSFTEKTGCNCLKVRYTPV